MQRSCEPIRPRLAPAEPHHPGPGKRLDFCVSRHKCLWDLPSRAIIGVKELGGDVGHFANMIFRAIWLEERDIGDETYTACYCKRRWSGRRRCLALAKSEATAIQPDRYTAEAQTRGVFGPPIYILGKKFWSQDRLDFLEMDLRDCPIAIRLLWTIEASSALEFAEANGLDPPSP